MGLDRGSLPHCNFLCTSSKQRHFQPSLCSLELNIMGGICVCGTLGDKCFLGQIEAVAGEECGSIQEDFPGKGSGSLAQVFIPGW